MIAALCLQRLTPCAIVWAMKVKKGQQQQTVSEYLTAQMREVASHLTPEQRKANSLKGWITRKEKIARQLNQAQ